ncbi:MAG: hypothetical protein OEX22_06255 [Cyclobacteriaceae bacterium]|nr:hypothetical protein [Cyclobacteriaceae bacterium]
MFIKPRYRFLLSNLWKGLVWFVGLVIIFVIVKQIFGPTEHWMEPVHNKPLLVYSIFLISEVVFGIVPPEVFMIWSIHGGISDSYIINVAFLSVISFGAGISGYFIGASMRGLPFFLHIEEKYLLQYRKYLKRFGGILVITAALTPLPFSAVAMAVAAFRFPFKYYFIYSLSRFVRFGVYGYIVWQANAF